ncbi:MAG: hypothetical protein ACKVVP_06955 [Chloroflexota bacterium]
MDAEGRVAALTIFFTLLTVKLATVIIVLILVPSSLVVELFLILNWFWFIPPIVLAAGLGMFWARMLRVRARRRELLRQEFTRSTSPVRDPSLESLLRRARRGNTPNQDTTQ